MAVWMSAATAQAIQWQVDGSVGAGWLTAPSADSLAEPMRPTWVFLGESWLDRGPIGIGTDVTCNLSNRTSTSLSGGTDQEQIVLTSGVLLLGVAFPLENFPASVRLGAGGGLVHSWDDLLRDGQTFQQESWGPEFHMVAIWEREMGRHGLVRIRLAAVSSWTKESEIMGAAIRSSSNWSRVEFSLGWGWRNIR